ncbi:uncharacterized protein LOC131842125 [Achroia grisella]|uniref:uncharacterized protein LOC131842125 n=1 Tax=Achroia grisella TaxID=688607 RepID=UPI0027D32B71|nr:uncharacterized protein LOC131842125 [Achroia grisella]
MSDSVTEADLEMEDQSARSRPVSRPRSRASRPSSASSTRSTRSTRSILVEDELSGCLVSRDDGLTRAAVAKRPHTDGSGPSVTVGGGVQPSKIPCPSNRKGAPLNVQSAKGPNSPPAVSRQSSLQGESPLDDVVFARPKEVMCSKPSPKEPAAITVYRAEAKSKLCTALATIDKCRNIKGVDTKKLKEDLGSILIMTERLDPSVTVDETFSSWAAERSKVMADLEKLRKENVELRKQINLLIRGGSGLRTPSVAPSASKEPAKVSVTAPVPAPSDVEAFRADILESAGRLISAQVEEQMRKGFIQLRALLDKSSPAPTIRPEYRPPLQSDGQYEVLSRLPGAGGPGFRDAPHLQGSRGADFPRLEKRQPPPRPVSDGQQPGPAGGGRAQEGGNTVVKRGKELWGCLSGEEEQADPAITVQTACAAICGCGCYPRSGAEAGGLTYTDVLKEAKSKIDLASLGIGSLRFKTAATGARILEIPGSQTGEQADALASKFQEVFPADTVRISRPVKTAEMRVMGLDDGTDGEEVAAAVAQQGECAAAAVKVGEIRRGASGLGTCWVRAPLAAVKRITTAGRIKIGWVTAAAELLRQKPLRCYRCLESGHVLARCSHEEDRSGLCYRCGEPGHKAAGCMATPHCVVCAAAGRPADHRDVLEKETWDLEFWEEEGQMLYAKYQEILRTVRKNLKYELIRGGYCVGLEESWLC